MLDRTPPSIARLPSGATAGFARLHVGAGGRLKTLEHSAPYRLLRPSGADVGLDLAVIANISGGLVGGDTMDLSIEASGDARLMTIGQAAEKAYRTEKGPAVLRNTFIVRDTAWLEILPKELIMFEGAHVQRSFELRVDGAGQMLAGDLSVLGRTHSGETIQSGALFDDWRLIHNDTLIYLDRQALDFSAGGGQAANLASAAALNGHLALGSLIYAGSQVEAFIATCRAILPADGVKLASSGFARHGLARLLSPDAAALLNTYGRLWSALRAALGDLPPRLPSLWSL